jgi:hypothetical protein
MARIAGYRIALDDVPSWAVEAAAKRWIRGDGMAPARFAPTPPELRQAALSIAGSFSAEAAALRRLGAAGERVEREIGEETSEKVARRFREMLGAVAARSARTTSAG